MDDLLKKPAEEELENLLPEEGAGDDELGKLKEDDDHGWKDLEAYVEDGGDAEMFRGKKAFNQYREMKLKERSKTDDANEHLGRLVEQQQELIDKATAKARTEERAKIESEMAQAETDLDFGKYKEAQEKLNTHKQQQAPKEDAPHPEWVSTLKDLPMLDQSGENYNQAFFNVFQGNLNNELIKIGKPPEQLSNTEVRYAMGLASDKSKTDMPHLFREQRKAPSSASPNSKNTPKGDLRNRLDEGSKGTYDYLLKNHGKDSAKQYAKNQLGE
jgi:hypothetical protein